MNTNLFKSSNTAVLDEEQIKALPTHRLKAYRKKLLKVIHRAEFSRDHFESVRWLWPEEDWSHIDDMESVLKIVNKEFARRS